MELSAILRFAKKARSRVTRLLIFLFNYINATSEKVRKNQNLVTLVGRDSTNNVCPPESPDSI